jgi:large subunit ribosomal protein L13
MYRSYMAKPEDIEHKWFLVDAEGKTLGRLASQVAFILRGKHKPIFTPHIDCGDHVIIINAEKVVLTGNKLRDKIYYRHTMYPGGLRALTYGKVLETQPERAVERAIKGMIPHTRLGHKVGMKLKVYKGPDHPHAAQKPELLDIKA